MNTLVRILLTIGIMSSWSCSTFVGNPQESETSEVELAIGAFSVSTEDVFDVSMCIAKITLSPKTNPTVILDLESAEVTTLSSGSKLLSAYLQPGDYRSVRIRLKPICADRVALRVTNNYGEFFTQGSLAWDFQGAFSIEANKNYLLSLNVQESLVQMLADIQSNEEILEGHTSPFGLSLSEI